MPNKYINNEERELLSIMHKYYGYDFRNYAPSMLKRRLSSFLAETRFNSIEEISEEILNNKTVLQSLIYCFSITVTEMFRNPIVYKKLQETVFPYLNTYPHIKIWHAGCATGEEVYSMAILLQEAGLYDKTQLYATDINETALTTAREGIYPTHNIKRDSNNYIEAGGKGALSEYYTAKNDQMIMHDSLKKNITFSHHNLVTDYIFGEMNLIVCRNVLIYFNKMLQEQILALFIKSLTGGGFLCVGNMESIKYSKQSASFKEISRKERIYQKQLIH